MKFLAAVSLVIPTLLSVTAAAPLAEPQTDRGHKGDFYLRVNVKPGQSEAKDRFDGLFVGTYHTGAGFNDVALWPKKYPSSRAFLKDGFLKLKSGNAKHPWVFQLQHDQTYSQWGSVQANTVATNSNTHGIFVEDGKLKVKKGVVVDDWAGWKACDWWHGVPQLFYNYASEKPSSNTPGCAEIELVVVGRGD